MDADTKLLCLLNTDSNVLIARQEYRVAHRMVARQRDHVGDDQRVHALLLARAVDEPEPDLQIRQVRKGNVLGSWAGRCAVVPVDAQQLDAAD